MRPVDRWIRPANRTSSDVRHAVQRLPRAVQAAADVGETHRTNRRRVGGALYRVNRNIRVLSRAGIPPTVAERTLGPADEKDKRTNINSTAWSKGQGHDMGAFPRRRYEKTGSAQ